MKAIRMLFLLLLVVLVLLAALIALFPARVAIDWLGPRLGALQLEDVSGTVWHGQAGRATVHGEPIGTLGWRVHPMSLFGGGLATDLSIDGAEFKGAGEFRAQDNVLHLRDATMTINAARLAPALDIPALNPRGSVDIELTRAELVGGFPRQLQGRAVWRDAAVDGAAAATFGDLVADFRTADDGALIGSLADQGGPLQLDGQFRVDFRGYAVDAVLAPRDGNPQVAEALRYIGQPQPDGSSVLEIRGQLLPLQ